LKPLPKRPGSRPAIRNRAGDGQFNFGAGSLAAPDLQFATDLPNTLTHPTQTVMTSPSALQNLGRNSLSIVPDADLERPLAVGDLGFNMPG
jgi:hypothetical protein